MTPVVFPDAQMETLSLLRALAPGVTFGTKPLAVGDAVSRPYVAVALDASFPGKARASQTAALRLAVWHESDAKGLALAQRLLALLTAFAGGSKVRSFRERTGPFPTTDPDTGSPLSYFTVAASLRPSPLE